MVNQNASRWNPVLFAQGTRQTCPRCNRPAIPDGAICLETRIPIHIGFIRRGAVWRCPGCLSGSDGAPFRFHIDADGGIFDLTAHRHPESEEGVR